MTKTGEIPYTWNQMEEQIKQAILCQASILEAFGPWLDQKLVADYLGLDWQEYRGKSVEDVNDIDITAHGIYVHAKVAYEYAYQLADIDRDTALSSWHSVDGLIQGFPETDADGEPSPFCRLNDFPLRRMLETFYARFGLFDGMDPELDAYMPSIRELALLSNMTVPAVRTSLSKEGFKLEKLNGHTRGNAEDSGFRLNTSDAKIWLSRRRGFIPQREPSDTRQNDRMISEIIVDRTAPFPDVVKRIIEIQKMDAQAISNATGLELPWLSGLLDGHVITADLQALRSLAHVLGAYPPDFVSAGIRHALLTENLNMSERPREAL